VGAQECDEHDDVAALQHTLGVSSDAQLAAKFSGMWSGQGRAHNAKGKHSVVRIVRLRCDEEGFVNGTVGWKATDDVGTDVHGNAVSEHSEDVLGLVDLHTGEIRLVETAEAGIYQGYVHADNTMTLWGTQSGTQPVVTHMSVPKLSSQSGLDQ